MLAVGAVFVVVFDVVVFVVLVVGDVVVVVVGVAAVVLRARTTAELSVFVVWSAMGNELTSLSRSAARLLLASSWCCAALLSVRPVLGRFLMMSVTVMTNAPTATPKPPRIYILRGQLTTLPV